MFHYYYVSDLNYFNFFNVNWIGKQDKNIGSDITKVMIHKSLIKQYHCKLKKKRFHIKEH